MPIRFSSDLITHFTGSQTIRGLHVEETLSQEINHLEYASFIGYAPTQNPWLFDLAYLDGF